jgi:large subunit ribosomal protein L18e
LGLNIGIYFFVIKFIKPKSVAVFVPNPTGPSNVELRLLIRFLRKASAQTGAAIWRYVADILEKPRRSRVSVNLSKIDRYAADNDVVIVPGKVLGSGELRKRVTIAAFKFSKDAASKIKMVGGDAINISELVKKNPKGTGAKIIT